MATKKTDEDLSRDEQIAQSEKLAEKLVPASAGVLLDRARKADTRADADAQTNQSTDVNAINIVKQLTDEPKQEKEDKKKPLSDAEYERRTHLDVSNPDYINPSLDHYKTGK